MVSSVFNRLVRGYWGISLGHLKDRRLQINLEGSKNQDLTDCCLGDSVVIQNLRRGKRKKNYSNIILLYSLITHDSLENLFRSTSKTLQCVPLSLSLHSYHSAPKYLHLFSKLLYPLDGSFSGPTIICPFGQSLEGIFLKIKSVHLSFLLGIKSQCLYLTSRTESWLPSLTAYLFYNSVYWPYVIFFF